MTPRRRVAEWIAASSAFWFGAWAFLPIVGGLLMAFSLWRNWWMGRFLSTLLLMSFFVGVFIIFFITNPGLTVNPLYAHVAIFYGLLAMAELSGRNE